MHMSIICLNICFYMLEFYVQMQSSRSSVSRIYIYYILHLSVPNVASSKIKQVSSFNSNNYELKQDDDNTSKAEMQYFVIFHSKIGDLYINKAQQKRLTNYCYRRQVN